MLLGLMGSGKTTVGRRLAAALHLEFADNDDLLRARTGASPAQIAARDGADALHRLEADVLGDALDQGPRRIITAAASTVLDPEVARRLRAHDVVYLRVTPKVAAERVHTQSPPAAERPFVAAGAVDVLRQQYAERDSAYRAVSWLTVDASASPESIVEEISSALAARRPPASTGE